MKLRAMQKKGGRQNGYLYPDFAFHLFAYMATAMSPSHIVQQSLLSIFLIPAGSIEIFTCKRPRSPTKAGSWHPLFFYRPIQAPFFANLRTLRGPVGYYFYIDPASQNKLSRHPVIPAKQLLFSLISSTVLSSTPAAPFQSTTARRYVPDRKYSKNIYALFYFSSRCREATAAKLQSSSTGNHCGTYDKHQTAAGRKLPRAPDRS